MLLFKYEQQSWCRRSAPRFLVDLGGGQSRAGSTLGTPLRAPLGQLGAGLRACFLARFSGLDHLPPAGLRAWTYRLKTTHLAEEFFRNLRCFLGRFPGFLSPEHADHALGLYLPGAETV